MIKMNDCICKMCGVEIKGKISENYAGILLCQKCWDFIIVSDEEDDDF